MVLTGILLQEGLNVTIPEQMKQLVNKYNQQMEPMYEIWVCFVVSKLDAQYTYDACE